MTLTDDEKKALSFWIEKNGGKVSVSSLQRGRKIGFARANAIAENLQKLGCIDRASGKVLVTPDQLN